ncbi:hypothetical protein [Brachybacterium sp. GPGPB12]|uniref:hypothetical protein n=1 Tax=Brachybacterium sp. GPGPB12 TaxID=3023517 RepID=UPI0031342B7D
MPVPAVPGARESERSAPEPVEPALAAPGRAATAVPPTAVAPSASAPEAPTLVGLISLSCASFRSSAARRASLRRWEDEARSAPKPIRAST